MHRHHFPIQNAALELRNLCGDLAERVNQPGDAIVGRANHPATGLQCAHLRHLQVLQRADGRTKPGVVADRQQQVAARRQVGGEVWIHHFVANEWRNLITLGL